MVQTDSRWSLQYSGLTPPAPTQGFVDLVWFIKVPGSTQMLAGCDKEDVQSPIKLTVNHGISSSACGAMIVLTSVSSICLQISWGWGSSLLSIFASSKSRIFV